MGIVNIILVIVGVTLVGLVLGISSFNEQAEAGGSIGGCDAFGENVIQHWDKIIFHPDIRLFNAFDPSPLFPPTLFPGITYDIKVEQDPLSLTNLEETVSKFLNANGYRTSDGKGVLPRFIDIVDVEYSIACPFTSPRPIVDVDMDGFSPPEDCDDGDPLVNPGATEVCNFIDDDCDTFIDEEFVCGIPEAGALNNLLP